MLWYERKECCMVSHSPDGSTSRHIAFLTSGFIAASPLVSWKAVLCPSRGAGQPRTAPASKLTGRSDTVATSVPQTHGLSAEIDISTKAKIFCCMFFSCHYIVSYCKIIVCPNLHYKMFFPT